ncbi:MAG: hypothetical protein WC708_07485 [Lentisphaeria bacterium]
MLSLRSACRGLAVVAAALTVGCSTPPATTLIRCWSDGNVPEPGYTKILIASALERADFRRQADDAFLAQMKKSGVVAVSSLDYAPADGPMTKETLTRAVKACGADAVLVLRRTGMETNTITTPGKDMPPAGSPLYDHYTDAWGKHYEPPTVEVQEIATVECRLYGVPQKTVVWTATCKVVNPAQAPNLAADFARLITEGLVKERQIRPTLKQ